MSFWDIFLLLIIAAFTIKGYFRGIIWEVFRIAGITLAYLFSHQFYKYFSKIFVLLGFSDNISKPFGYFIMFIVIFVAIILLSYSMKRFFKAIKLGWIDSFGGALFGFLKSVIIISLILSFVISIIPVNSAIYRKIVRSDVSSRILSLNPFIMNVINKFSGEYIESPFINRKEKIL
ncbi:MAG: CvpA family protein [Calditerrivibrio sp.]|nr:CvpA family protein [Calditerrivibrio sp.]MCA1979914.1 CvpA family protein [Calditerrivibrio sp.]